MSDLAAGVAFVDIEPKVSKGFAEKLSAGVEPALKNVGAKMSALGGSLTKVVTAPILGIGLGLLKAGSEIDSAFDTIRLKTGATGQELKGLEAVFRQVASEGPEAFDDVANALAILHARTGAVGPPLANLTRELLTLSRITKTDVNQNIDEATRVFGAWHIALKDQPEALNKIFRASQATGSQINDLQSAVVTFAPAFQQLGFSFDSSIALIGKFNKEGVNTNKVLGSLRIALAKTAKSGKDPVVALNETVKAIKNAGDQSKANAIALELFGARAGPELASAIRAGRFELGSLLEQIKSGDDIQTAAAQTDDFAESFGKLKNYVILAVEPLATRLFNALGDLAPKLRPVVDFIERLVSRFAELSPATQTIILIMAGLAAAVGPVLFFLGPLVTAFAGLASPIGVIVLGLGALAAVFVTAKVNGESFSEVLTRIVGKIREDAPKVISEGIQFVSEFLEKLGEAIVRGLPIFTAKFIVLSRAFLDWIVPLIPPALTELGHLLGALAGWILDTGLPLLVRTLHKLGTAFVDWVKVAGPPLLRELRDLLGDVVLWIVNVGLPELIVHVGTWGIAFISWITPSVKMILAKIPDILIAIGRWIVTSALPWLGRELLKLGVAFVEWIAPVIPKVLLALALLPLAIGEWILTTAIPWIAIHLLRLAGSFIEWIIPMIPKAIVALIQFQIDIVEFVLTKLIPGVAKAIAGLAVAFVSWLIDEIPKLPGQLEDFAKAIFDWLVKMPERITKAATGMFNGIKEAFKEAINYVIRGWNAIAFETPKIHIPGTDKDVGGDKITVPQLPELRGAGGPVLAGKSYFVGDRGIELATFGANAQITSNDNLVKALGGGAGPMVHIEHLEVPTAANADADEVADAVSRKIGWRVSLARPVR